MRIGLIVDDLAITRWQAEALLTLDHDAEFIVYNCTNSRLAAKQLRHVGYYALRLLSWTTRRTRRVEIPAKLRIVDRVNFESAHDGTWQSLPRALVEHIKSHQPATLVKFGMGLLRVPAEITVPILSYHHGDPRMFRGRPAGFYEILQRREAMGQVVQRLSNRLDAGEVVAYAETKVYPYSWRRTLAEAYSCSPFLLPAAIRNATAGVTLPIVPNGRNYRLPSNWTAAHFAARQAAALVKRMAYGSFFEKAWQIAQAPAPKTTEHVIERFPDANDWTVVRTPNKFRFLADPFYDADGDILAEGLRRNGRGEIVHVANGAVETVSDAHGHLSYPATLEVNGETFVVPEMSEWSVPHLYRFNADRLEDLGELDVGQQRRLVDPTLHFREGTFFLFGNAADESLAVLRLWFSDAPLGPWREHPSSPIRISPAGSRMAGSIMALGSKLVRIGQDLRGEYGDGVLFFEIDVITRDSYSEHPLAELRFAQVRGPHTINAGPKGVLFDFYRHCFSPFAGVRRVTSRVAARRFKSPSQRKT